MGWNASRSYQIVLKKKKKPPFLLNFKLTYGARNVEKTRAYLPNNMMGRAFPSLVLLAWACSSFPRVSALSPDLLSVVGSSGLRFGRDSRYACPMDGDVFSACVQMSPWNTASALRCYLASTSAIR